MAARKKAQTTSTTTRRTSSGKSRPSSSITPVATAFLSKLLPSGWQRYFDIRKAGKYWGLSIKCPVGECGKAPPSHLLGAQRWRWMAAHIAQHKPVVLTRGGREK